MSDEVSQEEVRRESLHHTTLVTTFESAETAEIVTKAIRGGITSDHPSQFAISLSGPTATIELHADTLKRLRKMYNSYMESIELALETIAAFRPAC